MKNLKSKKIKFEAVITIILFVVSVFALMAVPIIAQEDEPHGDEPILEENGSIPLPAGVTPDETYQTISHLSFRPNPVGVNQPILVNMWLQPPLHSVRYFKDNFEVTLTKPDGSVVVIGPMSSYQGDATAWFEYVMDQVGTWTIEFNFLGAYFPAGDYNTTGSFMFGSIVNFPNSVYYEPSSDGPYDLVVQDELVFSWPESPLPTDYWTRPVSVENREWWPILGSYPPTGIVGGGPSWPADTNIYMNNYDYVPYVQGPKSAHVVWKRQDAIGGLIGGPAGYYSWSGGGNVPALIFAGRCYDTVTKVFNGERQSVWQCYDLRTGEVYWEQLETSQRPTMVSYFGIPVETVPGEAATLGAAGIEVDLLFVGGGRLIKYDPWDGAVTLNVSIAPLSSGTFYKDPYFLTVQNLGGGNYRLINWTLIGDIAFRGATNIRLGVFNNVSWPFSSLGTVDFETGIAVVTQGIQTLGTGGIGPGFSVSYGQRLMGVSLETGAVLWNVTTDVDEGVEGFFSGSTQVADHGKYAVRFNDGHWHCYDLNSGHELWVGELSSWPWGTFGCYGSTSYGGMILSNQYDAIVAYDWDTGEIIWRYEAPLPYAYETPYYGEDHVGVYPWFTGNILIADGVLYTYTTEHTPSQPITRGLRLHAVNVSTGEGIWNITGNLSPGPLGDGYMTASNSYDGCMYVFGKGESLTTVDASPKTVGQGAPVLIEGTVLDQSPAQSGTPCVSKDSMATQMQYLHMQHPIDGVGHDEVISGVPVTLTAINEDGEHIVIDTTTTNGYYGTFSYMWVPPEDGKYEIIASFEGDDSYGSSAAATSVGVGQVVSSGRLIEPEFEDSITEQSSTQESELITETSLISSDIAIVLAIAFACIVGASCYLILKKRR